jgi:hypothetical protein
LPDEPKPVSFASARETVPDAVANNFLGLKSAAPSAATLDMNDLRVDFVLGIMLGLRLLAFRFSYFDFRISIFEFRLSRFAFRLLRNSRFLIGFAGWHTAFLQQNRGQCIISPRLIPAAGERLIRFNH